ncbi:fibropellin-1-like [Montipora foliosa]|uniref:fibropellin-1-like n=1 Tax=Montipora foliosa TaxID=591990 RepID=UPI0035F11B4E
MFCLKSLVILTVCAYHYSIFMAFGSNIMIREPAKRQTIPPKALKVSTRVPSNFSSLMNLLSSWLHIKDGVHPKRRQLQLKDSDDDGFFDSANEPTDVLDLDGRDGDDYATSRQVIFEPREVQTLRLPHPYTFEPLHSNWESRIEPLSEYPRPHHVHHFKGFPVPVRVLKYEHIPEPYYVPYKPTPDYTVLHVHVSDPVNPCMNGGLPLSSQFGYHCLCSKDYHGRFCDAKLYCSSSPCQNGGVCEEIENNYQCQCKTGYLGYNCEEKNVCRPNPCMNDGQCVETSNSYRCYCRPGFIGKDCEDLDYCDPNPCQNGGVCEQRLGFHECICREAYKGKVCELKRICFSNPCKNGGQCIEDDPSYPCICPRGYSPPHCKVHVCDSSPCQNGGRCVPNKEGKYWTYRCKCSLLFKGQRCELPNPCVANPCLNGGTCIDTYSKYTGFPKDWDIGYLHYYCACPPEYSGQKCEENLCLKCNANASCVHGRCICNEGFRGDGFKCTVIHDPCFPSPCQNNGTCTKGPDQSFDCTCPKGYYPPLCEKPPNDMCRPNPCKNRGICVNEGGAFRCICPADFLPPDCTNKTVDPCIPNPCQNKAKCHPSKDKKSFICQCEGRFKPPLCTCDCPKGDLRNNPPILPQRCKETGDCYCPASADGKEYSETPKGCERARGNPCSSNPCQNDGRCFVNDDKLSFFCQCPDECSGDLCQNCNSDKICTPKHCKNGGTCIVVGRKPFCKCPLGYQPPNCVTKYMQEHNACHPNPCQNGGSCRNVGLNKHKCICTAQYSGINCERDKCMDCDVQANCVNGRCKCRRGYTGSGHRGDCKLTLVCQTCPLNAVCVDGECSCINGFYLINDICKMIGGKQK